MRNLKRALSLLLSSTMVLGMVVMGGSAAGYQDVDASNDNQEAIEVLQAVGIMSGIDNQGNFGPDGSITRNEMAVVMAHLLNLDYDYYRGVNTFSDVPEWAAPYVAACVAEGVTAGVGNGLYGGDQQITAAQAGLMVMKALGYFQNQEDFGSDWQVATIRQASYIDLYNNVNSNAETALTRGQVAQLVLNGLKAKMVDFTGDKGIQIGDVTVGYKAEYTAKTSAAAKYDTIDDGTTNIAQNDQYYIQLGEELYNGDLKLSNDGMDDFGRPSRVWSYKSSEIGTYAKHELCVEEYTTAVTGSDMYNLLGKSVVTDADYDLTVYVDGAEYQAANTTDYDHFIKENFTRNNAADMENTGKGVLTEVYVDTNAKEITAVIVNTYLAEATADYNSKTEKLAIKVYNTSSGTTKNLVLDDFAEIADVKEGDFMLVNWADEKATAADKTVVAIQDVKVLSDVKVSKFSQSSGSLNYVTVDGTKYDAAASQAYDASVLNDYDQGLLTNKSYNVYLDQYGYAIGVDLFSGEANYVFITGYDLKTSNIANQTATANAIFLDGTMKAITVNVKDTNANIDTWNTRESNDYNKWNSSNAHEKVNTWYTYTLDESNSVYTLDVVDADLQLQTAYNTATTINSKNVRLDGSNARVSAALNSLKAYGNDDSVYITVDTAALNNATNVINEVTGIYTGIQNVDITSRQIASTRTVFAVFDENLYVIGAVVIGEDNGATSNYSYIFAGAKSEEKIGDTYYWEFDAVTSEGIQTLQVKTKYQSVIDTITTTLATTGSSAGQRFANGYLFKLSYDADGYVINAKNYENATTNYIFANDGAAAWGTGITDEIVRYMNVGATRLGTGVNDSDELMLISNTLYNKDEPTDKGLPLHPDAKFVVAQVEYGKFVKTEYDSIDAALSALYDYDPATDTTLDFQGTISAVLDNSGRATWVVFDSNGGFDADQNPSTNPSSDVKSVTLDIAGGVWLYNAAGTRLDADGHTYELWMRGPSQDAFNVAQSGTFATGFGTAGTLTLTSGTSYYLVVDGVKSDVITAP